MPKTARAAYPGIKDFEDLRVVVERAAWLAAKSMCVDEPDQIGEYEELQAKLGDYAQQLQADCDRMTWPDYGLMLEGSLQTIFERQRAKREG